MKGRLFRKVIVFAVAFMMIFALSACGNDGGDATGAAGSGGSVSGDVGSAGAGDSGEAFKVGWINATLSDAFYKVMTDTAADLAAELGWDYTMVDSQMDSTKELAAFEDMITNGVDLIFVDCVDPVAVVAGIRRANEANIPVIVVDNPVDDPAGKGIEVVTQVMSDNVGLGLAVGEWTAQNFDIDTSAIGVELSGQAGNQGNFKRRTGAWAGFMAGRINQKEGTDLTPEDLLERAYELENELIDNGQFYDERSDFSIKIMTYGNFSEAGGLQATEDMLSAHPDANLMFCESDPMAVGGMQAVETRNMVGKLVISCVANGTKASLDLIKEGKIASCGENNPVKVAQLAIDQGVKVQEGADASAFEPIYYTPPVVIDANNVDEFLAEAVL